MRLVTFRYEGTLRTGAVVGNQVIDLHRACRALLESKGKLRARQIADAYIPDGDMAGFLQGGAESLALAGEAIAFALDGGESSTKLQFQLDEVVLAAPVQNPSKIICVGHNYLDHILETGREVPKFPQIFAKYSNTLNGPYDDVLLDPVGELVDYEAELGFVMGSRARRVSRDEALQYVAGYTVANDVSYRDLQRRTLQWLQGKTVEGSAPMGPCILTSDELADPSGSGLEVKLTVNGEVRQHGNTKNLVFTVPILVEYLSSIMTLEPGDIVLTGTCGGVGDKMNPPVYLKDGDVVKVEISHIGYIENTFRKP